MQCRIPALLTDAEFLDQCTILLDIFRLQVVEQAATFTNEVGQCALGAEVLAVELEVLCEVFDTEGELCDLTFGRTGVLCALAELGKELCFFLRCQIHAYLLFGHLPFTIWLANAG